MNPWPTVTIALGGCRTANVPTLARSTTEGSLRRGELGWTWMQGCDCVARTQRTKLQRSTSSMPTREVEKDRDPLRR